MYKDRIEIWDAVNEPTHLQPIGGQTLYNYVANCFNWVKNKDANALLTINDFGIMGHDFGYGRARTEAGGPFGRILNTAETGAR